MPTFYDRFLECAQRWPQHTALELQRHDQIESCTYAELRRMAESVGRWITEQGFAQGSRLAIVADNHPRWVAAYLGIIAAGCVVVPLDTALHADQLTKLLASCSQEREFFFCVPSDRWWTALMLVIYDTGVRISATMSIRRADVDLAAGTLLVRAEEQKQKADQLFEPVAQTLAAVREIWLPERELLFQYPYDQTQEGWPSLTSRLKKILKRAGLPATLANGGTSWVTTAPAPTIAPRPMVTPGRTIALIPISA